MYFIEFKWLTCNFSKYIHVLTTHLRQLWNLQPGQCLLVTTSQFPPCTQCLSGEVGGLIIIPSYTEEAASVEESAWCTDAVNIIIIIIIMIIILIMMIVIVIMMRTLKTMLMETWRKRDRGSKWQLQSGVQWQFLPDQHFLLFFLQTIFLIFYFYGNFCWLNFLLSLFHTVFQKSSWIFRGKSGFWITLADRFN